MSATSTSARIESLDQFRGLTVVAMLIVNFLGGYTVCPILLKHSHDYCSFADLVMPQFLFAAGFSMRLSFLKQVDRFGNQAAWLRMFRRITGLIAISIFWYSFTTAGQTSSNLQNGDLISALLWLCKRGWFQTLMHIAVTSAWILPVLQAGLSVRVAWAAISAVLHLGLSWWFNFHWVNTGSQGIDGGPLGFLTWTMPMIAGTWAYDLCMTRRPL
ncbi:MAG: DUF1624 domain-containing protein, partial [Planctomyces sp.]|nr:DUF1624 domain-containing protein [Planctomyces sp.]